MNWKGWKWKGLPERFYRKIVKWDTAKTTDLNSQTWGMPVEERERLQQEGER